MVREGGSRGGYRNAAVSLVAASVGIAAIAFGYQFQSISWPLKRIVVTEEISAKRIGGGSAASGQVDRGSTSAGAPEPTEADATAKRRAEATELERIARQEADAEAVAIEQTRAEEVRRQQIADETERRKVAEAAEARDKANAAAAIATEADRTKLADIAGRWPDLAPQVQQRAALLDAEDAKTQKFKVTQQIQDGLRRTGCFAGPTTGNWATLTKKAAGDFNKYSPKKIAVDGPAMETAALLEQTKARVCPLTCSPPQVAQNGVCVVVNCPAGEVLTRNGICEAGYVAWIGVVETKTGAEMLFGQVQQGSPDLFANKQADIKLGQGERYSVRIGPAAAKDEIKEMCGKILATRTATKCYAAPL